MIDRAALQFDRLYAIPFIYFSQIKLRDSNIYSNAALQKNRKVFFKEASIEQPVTPECNGLRNGRGQYQGDGVFIEL